MGNLAFIGVWILGAWLVPAAQAQEACATSVAQSLSAGYYPAASGGRDTTHQAEFLARARTICAQREALVGSSWTEVPAQTSCVADCLETVGFMPPGSASRALDMVSAAIPECVSRCPRFPSFGGTTDATRHGARGVNAAILDRCIRRFTQPGYGLAVNWTPREEGLPAREVQVFLHQGYALEVCLRTPEIWARREFATCMAREGGRLLNAAQYDGPASAELFHGARDVFAVPGRNVSLLLEERPREWSSYLSAREVTLLRSEQVDRALWDCSAPTPSELGAGIVSGLENLYEAARERVVGAGVAMGLVTAPEPDATLPTGESGSVPSSAGSASP